MADLLSFVQKRGCHDHELLFGNSGPPTKSTSWPEGYVKISCPSLYYFQRYGHLNVLHIWLKTPIPAPKIYVFWGVLAPNIIFCHRDPQKALPWPKRRILSY